MQAEQSKKPKKLHRKGETQTHTRSHTYPVQLDSQQLFSYSLFYTLSVSPTQLSIIAYQFLQRKKAKNNCSANILSKIIENFCTQ